MLRRREKEERERGERREEKSDIPDPNMPTGSQLT